MNARGYSVIPLVITGNNERMSETFITTALLQNPLIDVLIGTVKQGTAISGVLIQDVLDFCQHTVAFLDLSCSQFTFLFYENLFRFRKLGEKMLLGAGGS